MARAVIFDDDGKLLLIERHRAGEHYFALPGGHVEPGETSEQAVVREAREETGLTIVAQKLLYTFVDELGNEQRIYLCASDNAKPALSPGSTEAQAMARGEQQWRPAWFAPEQVRGQIVYPRGLLDCLADDRAVGWRDNPRKISEPRV